MVKCFTYKEKIVEYVVDFIYHNVRDSVYFYCFYLESKTATTYNAKEILFTLNRFLKLLDKNSAIDFLAIKISRILYVTLADS